MITKENVLQSGMIAKTWQLISEFFDAKFQQQVFDKYLKARKEMNLSYDEINHLKKVAASIKKTIEIQEAIDNLCSTWI